MKNHCPRKTCRTVVEQERHHRITKKSAREKKYSTKRVGEQNTSKRGQLVEREKRVMGASRKKEDAPRKTNWKKYLSG